MAGQRRTLPAKPAANTGPTVIDDRRRVLAALPRRSTSTPTASPTGEAENFRFALRPLRRLYGATAAAEFGPKSLKALRAAMLLQGCIRCSNKALPQSPPR